MLAKALISLAVGLWLVGVGCALVESDFAEHAPPLTSRPAPVYGEGRPFARDELLPLRGAVIQLQRTDWQERYEQSIDELAALGFDSVKFVLDGRMENGSASRIYLDLRLTPSPEMLAALIRRAKARGLRVVVMPIVLLDKPRGQEWRGTIKPESWDDWWQSYREFIGHFAWVAQGNGADVMVVGSELVSTEPQIDQWRRTIDHVRASFKGKLTYSSNWDVYQKVPFWDRLDLIGMNSYWKLGKNRDATAAEIETNWRKIQADLLPWVRSQGKPLLFLEVGWCSMENAAHEPWDYTTGDALDLALQKRLYEGFFACWHGEPTLGGFFVWEWSADKGGPKDRGYTPKGKPAEEVLRRELTRPAWEVR